MNKQKLLQKNYQKLSPNQIQFLGLLQAPIISLEKRIKEEIEDEYAPKLFSEEHNIENSKENDFSENQNTTELFDQDLNEDEDFEIPAFLRRQKF